MQFRLRIETNEGHLLAMHLREIANRVDGKTITHGTTFEYGAARAIMDYGNEPPEYATCAEAERIEGQTLTWHREGEFLVGKGDRLQRLAKVHYPVEQKN